ncbi:MAG TPA: hypothetical protein VK348_04605, partial [Planctomycetota bacterium]|nr:hypothetical protein [Planctomycetota bacterium]
IPACAPRLWPWTRVHSTGGFNITTQQNILVDPSITTVAVGGWVKDAALGDPTYGLFHTLPGDDHLHWAQADFVRKVSTITFGFFDTLRPNRNDIRADAATVTQQQGSPVVWPGLNNPPIGAPATGSTGFPDLAALSQNLRVSDLVTQLDPPAARQPAGTSVTLEFRGAADIGTTAAQRDLYNRTLFDTNTPPRQIGDRILLRGNLLNPSFACEAYRYTRPNSGASGDTARILVPGLTAYVDREHLDSIRDANGLLPRYLNMRLVMTNNVFVTPALSPSLRSFAIIYRMQ